MHDSQLEELSDLLSESNANANAGALLKRANTANTQVQAAMGRKSMRRAESFTMGSVTVEKEASLAAATTKFAGDPAVRELRALFDALDTDGDGFVDRKEWGGAVSKHRAAMSKFFGGSTLREVGSKFKVIDADGNNELSWEEFVEEAAKASETIAENKQRAIEQLCDILASNAANA